MRNSRPLGHGIAPALLAAMTLLTAFAVAICPAEAPQAPDPIIEAARRAAAAYAKSLPDYIVKRTTRRYVRDRRQTFWQQQDTVSGDVAFERGHEIYTNVTVNGKPSNSLPKNGVWSTGEFSSQMTAILSLASAAVFTHPHSETIGKQVVFRYDFAVDQAHSSWHVDVGNTADAQMLESYAPGYTGTIRIDKETGQVLRIEMATQGMPPGYPVSSSESLIDYGFVRIGARQYLLPTHSETVMCERLAGVCLKNETDFKDYDKFSASASISFEEESK